MRRTRWIQVLGALFAFALLTTACGDDDKADEATDTTAKAETGALTGMKGTTPLVDLPQSFKDRMKEVDPALVDFNYGAESYDATITVALAAAEAKDDGIAYASKINGITRGGEKCTP